MAMVPLRRQADKRSLSANGGVAYGGRPLRRDWVMGRLAAIVVVSACFILPSALRAQNAATFVPPPGTTKAPGIKFEQDGDVRAGTLGLAGTASQALDWAAADGSPGVIDQTSFTQNPLTPSLPSHKLLVSL